MIMNVVNLLLECVATRNQDHHCSICNKVYNECNKTPIKYI